MCAQAKSQISKKQWKKALAKTKKFKTLMIQALKNLKNLLKSKTTLINNLLILAIKWRMISLMIKESSLHRLKLCLNRLKKIRRFYRTLWFLRRKIEKIRPKILKTSMTTSNNSSKTSKMPKKNLRKLRLMLRKRRMKENEKWKNEFTFWDMKKVCRY